MAIRGDREEGAARALASRRSACLAGLLTASLALQAGAVRAQSLPEASASALENSFTLRADRARQDGAEARLRGAVDAFMPTVAIVADKPLQSRYDYFPQIAPTRLGFDDTPRKAPTVVGLTAELPLFDGFRRWNNLQSARTLVEAGRFQTLSLRQQILLDTAVAYITVLRDTRILGYRESQVAAIARIREATEKQFEVQDATRTDVALTRSRVQEAQAARDRALADLAAARREFIRLARVAPERMTPPRFPDNLPRDENAYAELVRAANPGIAAAQLDAKAAAQQADAALADFMPQVNLQFSRLNQYGYSQGLDRITDTTTRIVARLPVYEPGAFPRLGEASALARQRGYEAQDGELNTLTSARTAFARRKAIADQLVRLTERVSQLRETMKGFEIERGAGFRTVLDELNIRAELADAEVGAAVVLTERDAQSLQLAAAANLLDIGTSVPASKRFEAILPAPTAPALRRSMAEDGAPPGRPRRSSPAVEPAPSLRTTGMTPDQPIGELRGEARPVAPSRVLPRRAAQQVPVLRVSQAE